MKPDLKMAMRFIALFGSGIKTFQTFTERPGVKENLSKILHDPDLGFLAGLSSRGAGIFMMINEGDGEGRRQENVIRVRGFFGDFDRREPGGKYPIHPSVRVRTSPGRYHEYWLLNEFVHLTNEQFNHIQRELARVIGSEENDATGINRVMRLVGFPHQKGEEFLTEILYPSPSDTPSYYTLEEFLAAFEISLPINRQEKKAGKRSRKHHRNDPSVDLAVKSIRNAEEGERNNVLNSQAYHLGRLIAGKQLSPEGIEQALIDAGCGSGLPPEEVKSTVRRALSDGINTPVDPEEGDKKTERASPSRRLFEFLKTDNVEFWTGDGNFYVTVQDSGKARNFRPDSADFIRYAKGLYYSKIGEVISDKSIKELVGLIESHAISKGVTYPVGVRLSHHNGVTYIDLCQSDYKVIRIDKQGWQRIDSADCPVRFLRPLGILPLPDPVPGGNLGDLRPFLSLSDGDFILVVAWLVGAMAGIPPFPVLSLSGQHGSGKSTISSALSALIDPNMADRTHQPSSVRDLFITAGSTHILRLENLSALPGWLSDGLCVISTGGVYKTRKLHSDTDLVFLKAVKPVILNGIPDLIQRGDLADRAVGVQVVQLPQEARLPEQEYWQRFNDALPRLLGALLSAVVHGLARFDEVEIDYQPRMLGFVRLVVAAEPVLPWEPGAFLQEYLTMHTEGEIGVLDGDALAQAVMAWMDTRDQWEGTTKALLMGLTEETYVDRRPPQDWPMTPRMLGNELRRLAPSLRAAGYSVESLGRKTGGHIRYRLEKIETDPATFTMSTQAKDTVRAGWQLELCDTVSIPQSEHSERSVTPEVATTSWEVDIT